MRVGDLISFKPKSFGDDDWSNPCIVLDAFGVAVALEILSGSSGLMVENIWSTREMMT